MKLILFDIYTAVEFSCILHIIGICTVIQVEREREIGNDWLHKDLRSAFIFQSGSRDISE